MANKKEPLLKPDMWNKLTGKDLQGMGYRVDSNGYLIAATIDYEVWIKPLSWDIRQARRVIITLKELKLGDKFFPASKIGKKTPIFKVVGPCEWSSGGTSVRRCIDLSKNEFVNKQCRLEVVKTN